MKKATETASEANLKVGDVFKRDGQEFVVWFVNSSRAAIAPLDSKIKFRIRDEDGKIQFLARQESENISPNSEVATLRRLGRKGLAAYLEEGGTEKTEKNHKDMRKKNSKPESKKETTTRAGKLGGYKGHSVTSICRAFGKAGWSYEEARAFFDKKDIEVADATIKIQLRAGKNGVGGDPASFSKDELASMRPKGVKSGKAKPATEEPKKKKKKVKAKPAPEEAEEEVEEKEEEEVEEEAAAEA